MRDNELGNWYKGVCLELKSVINRNTQSIEKMIAYTDEYYGKIAESLPQIEDDIKESIGETRVLVSFFNKNKSSNNQQIFYKLLNELENKIEDINSFLDNKADLFNVLNNIISDKEEKKSSALKKIIALTTGLKKILSQLKLLAINSRIYTYNNQSQRANGFNVISEKIHGISTEMAGNYSNIEDHISLLINWHQEFQANLEEVVSIEESIKNNYRSELEIIFQGFFDFLNEVSGLLEKLMELVNDAISPVYELMIEIQNQDIIRQQLENISKILTKTGQEIDKGFKNSNESQEIDDRINFILEVINLLEKLNSGVQGEINSSQKNIRLLLGKVEDSLINVHKLLAEVKEVIYVDVDSISISSTKGDYIYNKIFLLLPEIEEKINQVKDNYRKLLNSEEIFQTNINKINEEFNDIKKFTNRLKNIRVLATIELSIMDDQNNFVQKIDKVVNDLIKKNNEGNQMVDRTGQALQEIVENTRDTSDAIKEIANAMQEQSNSAGQIQSAVEELDQVTQENAALVEEIASSSESLNDESKDMLKIVNKFKLNNDESSDILFEHEAKNKVQNNRNVNFQINENDFEIF